MQDKQKVTLYLPPELHRQMKITAAVTSEPMSALAEKAITFYLRHSEVVDGVQGQANRVHSCPSCSASIVFKDNGLVPLRSIDPSNAVIDEIEAMGEGVACTSHPMIGYRDEEKLVAPC